MDCDTRPRSFRELSRVTEEHYFPHTVRMESQVLLRECGLICRDLGEVSLVRLNWGAAVTVETEHPDAFAVNIPLRGRLGVRSTRGPGQAASGQAVVCPPDTPVSFPQWGAEVTMLGVRMGADYLRNQLELAGVTTASTPTVIDLSGGAGREWQDICLSVIAGEGHLAGNPLFRRNLAAALASGLALVLAEHGPTGPRATPARLRRAVDALESDPARPWTVGEIAQVAGCGVRTLQGDFREQYGVGPVEYLRGIRLSVIHDELVAADARSGVTVTDIALTWGVAHLGRFSSAYRRRFGQAPSETLKESPE
ncbi:MAG: AraC family transcriptional regulator [Corynebacterium sp.]|uniref:AraC family transcriptional regulator n=1 Tax=Corynebacterium sp. TaxID=1720 RepID=UPI0026DFA5F8|nr:AraC family transcriptional regulator [Corynebacterium sp.]MDO5668697.1 AraC family transcriptional regulator [Corynebacterium sp.]